MITSVYLHSQERYSLFRIHLSFGCDCDLRCTGRSFFLCALCLSNLISGCQYSSCGTTKFIYFPNQSYLHKFLIRLTWFHM